MNKSRRILGWWIMLGVAMLIVQVLLGGITRLTGSGLSMTDWDPIMDAIPPLTETDWQSAFDAYKNIGQFKYINADFGLNDFKFIYFWEWFHRNWARFILVAFLIPFIYFLTKSYFKREDIPKLLMLVGGGFLLGIVGWIMVKSGLNDSDLYVGHYELAMHFNGAMLLISLTFWVGLQFLYPERPIAQSATLRNFTILLLSLLVIQFIFGAFMAGLKAATAAPTWPDINGELIPTTMKWPLTQDKISIHFIHRSLAYIIFILVTLWTFIYRNAISCKGKYLPFILVIIQLILGVLSILYAPQAVRNGFGRFEWSAQLHQICAMLLLLSLVWHIYHLKRLKKN